MALNPARRGNMGRLNSSQPLTVYDSLTAQSWLKGVIEQIRGEKPISGVDGGDEKAVKKAREALKKQLPIRAIHYYRFRNNHRSAEDADPESFLFQTTIDVDDMEYVEQALEKARELNCSDTIWKGKLLHLEYSARKKLHIDIRMPMGMTIEETQKAYCEAAGIPYDKSCITPERIIFITDKASEIYRSKDWYAVLPAEELKARREAFLKRGLTIDGRGKVNFPQISQMTQIHSDSASEKNLIAFDLFVQSAGLEGMAIDTVGSRHSSLLAIMSAGASRVMSEEELMKVVRTKMPSYYQEDDCHQLIHDFYAKYADSSKPMSRDVIRVNAMAEKQASQIVNSLQFTVESPNANHTVQSSNLQVQCSDEDYPEPPEMPEKLPKLVELLISRTPEIYKPAVAHAIFPPLATHLWQTSFRYIDNVVHEATLSTCLLAGTGAGKSSVDKPIRYIMEDIRKRDAENLKREKEWKEEVTRKGANKDKRKRPDNLVIQEIDADMTSPAFVMRTAEAQGRFLYTSLNELDQFDALRGSGNQQFRIMCLAFDPFNLFGQQRVGVQSVTERVTIRFNWNASTTIQKGQRYFSKVLTDGPISRINFCTIPEREIGDEMPVYGDYNDAYREALKPYIENLNNARGLIDCPEAFQLALKLKDENAEFSRLSQDRVYENLSFRANVIAYLKACVLYVANGCKWEPEIDEFIRWSERYDLYCKMRFFGDAIKRANDTGEKSSKRGPSNMLMQLPDEFTYQQVIDLRVANGMSQKGTSKMLGNWKDRHYIRAKENDSVPQFLSSSVFIKLKFRKENS